MSIPKMVYKKFKVEKIPVERPVKGSVTEEPFVRVSVDGKGCPLLGCNCSAPNYISISDGETIMYVELTESQARAVRKGILCLGEA